MGERRGSVILERIDAEPEDARQRTQVPWAPRGVPHVGLLPPETKEYGLEFFRKLFDRAERLHYMEDGCLHVSILYRFCQRMSDCLGEDTTLFDPLVVFSDHESPMISWRDMRAAFEEHYYAAGGAGDTLKFNTVVRLNTYERVNHVMNGDAGSYLGSIWGLFTFVLILISIAAILSPSLQGMGLQAAIVIFFSFDYLVKLICAGSVRAMVNDMEALLAKTVPDPAEKKLEAPLRTTPFQRMMSFVLVPMNIVDLVSILPFWIDLIVMKSNIKLGFLRALRILRVVRLLKVGNFSDTLMILGDTLRRSVQSLVVMSIWIIVLSLIVGACLQQFEEGHGKGDDGEKAAWSFDYVGASCLWVSGRLVNMHGSLLAKDHIPTEDVSFYLVVFVGICKACVCIIPVGQIAAAFKEADEDFQRGKRIEAQIRREANVPLGTEWMKDHQSACVEVEILEADSGSLAGIGSFNIPIMEPKWSTCAMRVPIDSKTMRGVFQSATPNLKLRVSWEPDADFRTGAHDRPTGKLTLTLETGDGFMGDASQRWKALFRIPVKIHSPGDPMQDWMTGASQGGAPEPSWQASMVFNISWEEGGVSKVSASAKEQLRHERLLKELRERSAQITSLERALGLQ